MLQQYKYLHVLLLFKFTRQSLMHIKSRNTALNQKHKTNVQKHGMSAAWNPSLYKPLLSLHFNCHYYMIWISWLLSFWNGLTLRQSHYLLSFTGVCFSNKVFIQKITHKDSKRCKLHQQSTVDCGKFTHRFLWLHVFSWFSV